MDPQDTIDFSREALMMIATVGGPILAAGLAIGLVVGIFQAMTQIQDQTVSAVPKILGMLFVTMLVLPWIGERMIDYTKATLETPMIGGLARAPAAVPRSPFRFASAKMPVAPGFSLGPVERVAGGRPLLVVPPLKTPATGMPTMFGRPTSMPVHPYGRSPDRGNGAMPQLRAHDLTPPPVNENNLEG